MTQHIIDTDELEKLLSAVTIDTFAGEPYVIGLTEIRALIANSPQADDMVLDSLIDRVCLKAAEIHNLGKFVSDTEAQNVINEIRAMLSAYKPQADDVRKDAERYRWLRHGDNDELVIKQGNVDKNYHWLPRLQHLDEEIDKHMASEAIDKARE